MKTEKNKPIYIGFASQKGGVGKSSLAEILASILYYEKGVKLFVVDCDGTQESFFKLRERERALIEEEPDMAEGLQRHFEAFGQPSYRILRSTAEQAIKDCEQYLDKTQDIDLVLFDFPGHSGTRDLLTLSCEMDYIISPIEADVQSLASSLAYAKTIRDLGISMTDVRIKDLLLLWNKVDRRASTRLIDHYNKYIKKEELSLFKSRIHSAVRISHELAQGGLRRVFRSSYLPPNKSLRKGLGIDEWVEELLLRINLNRQ